MLAALILILAVVLVAGIIQTLFPKQWADPETCEHEWYDPSLHMNIKPIRCARCGIEQAQGQGGE